MVPDDGISAGFHHLRDGYDRINQCDVRCPRPMLFAEVISIRHGGASGAEGVYRPYGVRPARRISSAEAPTIRMPGEMVVGRSAGVKKKETADRNHRADKNELGAILPYKRAAVVTHRSYVDYYRRDKRLKLRRHGPTRIVEMPWRLLHPVRMSVRLVEALAPRMKCCSFCIAIMRRRRLLATSKKQASAINDSSQARRRIVGGRRINNGRGYLVDSDGWR